MLYSGAGAVGLVQHAFCIHEPSRLMWCADVAQHSGSEGWSYPAAVLDAAGDRIVGWSMGESGSPEKIDNAVSMATGPPKVNGGLIYCAEWGLTYTSLHFGGTLARTWMAAAAWAAEEGRTTTQ
jgi:transposase InsO family protein